MTPNANAPRPWWLTVCWCPMATDWCSPRAAGCWPTRWCARCWVSSEALGNQCATTRLISSIRCLWGPQLLDAGQGDPRARLMLGQGPHVVPPLDHQPRTLILAAELLQEMTEGLTCRVIDEGHTRAQVEIHRPRIVRKLPQLPNHVEQVETHQGTIQIQVVGAVTEFPLRHRVAEQTEEAAGKARPCGFRTVPQGMPKADVPQVQHELEDDAGDDAHEEVRRDG